MVGNRPRPRPIAGVVPLALGLLAAAVLLTGAITFPASATATPMTRLIVTGAGGVRLHAWVSKSRRTAATIIVINGGPGFSHLAEPPAEVLAPQFRVVFYDQRGTGLSRAPRPHMFDLPHQAADVEALRRALGTQRVDLLGHSWGGLVAAAYAARYPQHVRALVLADAEPANGAAASHGTALLLQRISALIASGVIPSPLPPVVGDDCTALLNAYLPAYLANPRLHLPPTPPGACRQSIMTETNAAQTSAVRAAVISGLRRYRGRALVIFGAQDPFRPAFQPADLAELPAAHVQLSVLPHAGHLVWAESGRFFPIVRQFLGR